MKNNTLLYILLLILFSSPVYPITNEISYTNKEKGNKIEPLEEIYRQAREREKEVIIPPQIDRQFFHTIEKLRIQNEIGILLNEFIKYKNKADKNPGKKTTGNILLGAPGEQYFRPSEEAKRLSEIGASIEKILNSANSNRILIDLTGKIRTSSYHPCKIIFNKISFYYVDAVGSGRFFYPNPPQNHTVFITKTIFDKCIQIKGEKIKDHIKIKQDINNLTETQNILFLEKLLKALKTE